nr:MAG TPA: hypothetical protein [Inoviridae sp.]
MTVTNVLTATRPTPTVSNVPTTTTLTYKKRPTHL